MKPIRIPRVITLLMLTSLVAVAMGFQNCSRTQDTIPTSDGSARAPANASLAGPTSQPYDEQFFKKGINALSDDGMFNPPYWTSFDFATFDKLKMLGFDHIRLNLVPFKHLDESNALTSTYLTVVHRVLNEALQRNLKVIVDVHEFLYCQPHPQECQVKLRNTWKSLATALKDYDNRVGFEILNEPGGQMTVALWNEMILENLAIIRTDNPTRKVIFGPLDANSFHRLEEVQFPRNDHNLIMSIHYYEPFIFTHQQAPWSSLANSGPVSWGTQADLDKLEDDFTTVRNWAKANNLPIYVGEFGVYDLAPTGDRYCFFYHLVRNFENLNLSWAYWQLNVDFRLLDEKTGRWNYWIADALMTKHDLNTCPAKPK